MAWRGEVCVCVRGKGCCVWTQREGWRGGGVGDGDVGVVVGGGWW